tara:strand:- start:975 stop:1136 length:162 start_codon:yes stop_codon:yes gene_type:complete
MKNNIAFKVNIAVITIMITYGIYKFFSNSPFDSNYWGTLFILFALLIATFNKE